MNQAEFSPCLKYRYTLWRPIGAQRPWEHPYVQFIGLNPSTATETVDDNTVRRCTRFAQSFGYDSMCMTNLFGLRSTDPKGLRDVADPIGPDNDRWLVEIANGAAMIIAAWGTHGAFMGREEAVLEILRPNNLHVLQLTQGGRPHHPLYLRTETKPLLWRSAT